MMEENIDLKIQEDCTVTVHGGKWGLEEGKKKKNNN